MKSENRLLLISNRLPITITRSPNATFEFTIPSGGLASGLGLITKDTKFHRYGWPGLDIPEPEREALKKRLLDEHGAIPIFLSEGLAQGHYNGFSSTLYPRSSGSRQYRLTTDSILWPLFHCHPNEITFDESAWQAYKYVNRIFAKTVAKDVQDNDTIWVHDYHLMLLPAMLREELGESKKNIKIRWFLHTSVPSCDVYRVLPVRRELLEGVLHADVIGFHDHDYTRHFLSSCSEILYTALPWYPLYITY
jgi:trehalose 6-phosphate synthase